MHVGGGMMKEGEKEWSKERMRGDNKMVGR